MELNKPKFTLKKRKIKSMKDIAYEAISESILSGNIPAGDRLIEAELSRQLNISRGPIREALLRLMQEGLVYSYPYKGAVVAEISAKETREVYIPIRMIVERYAFHQARHILTDEDYDYLYSLVDELYQACKDGDTDKIAKLDTEFHEAIVEKCASPTLRAIWSSLSSRISLQIFSQTRFANSATSPDNSTVDIADEHSELLQCLKSNDMEKLDILLDDHIRIKSETFSPKHNNTPKHNNRSVKNSS
jgi:DNA-binding GntR family transcriptional regulator